jgi:hypothetical protein
MDVMTQMKSLRSHIRALYTLRCFALMFIPWHLFLRVDSGIFFKDCDLLFNVLLIKIIPRIVSFLGMVFKPLIMESKGFILS